MIGPSWSEHYGDVVTVVSKRTLVSYLHFADIPLLPAKTE